MVGPKSHVFCFFFLIGKKIVIGYKIRMILLLACPVFFSSFFLYLLQTFNSLKSSRNFYRLGIPTQFWGLGHGPFKYKRNLIWSVIFIFHGSSDHSSLAKANKLLLHTFLVRKAKTGSLYEGKGINTIEPN